MTRHVFLSPHLDDVVLSCGGTLSHLVNRGASVKIITIFAGVPAPNVPLSSFAHYQHTKWGNLKQAYLTRRAEDRAAMACFNLEPTWLSFLDCIYRGRPGQSAWYYTSNQDIFGPLHPAEADFSAQIAAAIQTHIGPGQTTGPQSNGAYPEIYAPLTVGNHVDHQLTCLAAARLARQGYGLTFYEDYPYVQRTPAALTGALQKCYVNLSGQQHEQPNSRHVFALWQPKRNHLSKVDLAAKINAIAAYASQLDMLFGGYEAMVQKVTAYAGQAGEGPPAERFWKMIGTN